MNNDKYKLVTIISLITLFFGVILFKIVWLLPIVGLVSSYTYYKRILMIPKEERWRAAIPTVISITIIILLLVCFNFWLV